MIGRRFIESEAYRRARPHLRDGHVPDDLAGIAVMSSAEMRAELHLRTYADLTMFDIDGTPHVSELPAVSTVPSLVETIPTDFLQVDLAAESTEVAKATAVDEGTAFVEAEFDFGAQSDFHKLPRVGVATPVTLDLLDDPGRVASLLDRRMTLGVGVGLEDEMLNGNDFWDGALGLAASTEAKGAEYRALTIRNGVAKVQALGWHVRPLQVVIGPLTMAAMFEEEDDSHRPLPVMEVFSTVVDTWVVSTAIPEGQALVGDYLEAIALFAHGGLEAGAALNHSDFFTRSMAELTVGGHFYSWVRNPTALCLVTGIEPS